MPIIALLIYHYFLLCLSSVSHATDDYHTHTHAKQNKTAIQNMQPYPAETMCQNQGGIYVVTPALLFILVYHQSSCVEIQLPVYNEIPILVLFKAKG